MQGVPHWGCTPQVTQRQGQRWRWWLSHPWVWGQGQGWQKAGGWGCPGAALADCCDIHKCVGPAALFEPVFSSLLHLSILVGNPFNCSCSLRWLQLWQNSSRAELGNQSLLCWEGNVQVPLSSQVLHACGTWLGFSSWVCPLS